MSDKTKTPEEMITDILRRRGERYINTTNNGENELIRYSEKSVKVAMREFSDASVKAKTEELQKEVEAFKDVQNNNQKHLLDILKERDEYREKYTCNQHTIVNLRSELSEIKDAATNNYLKVKDLESQLSSAKDSIEEMKEALAVSQNNEKYYKDRVNEQALEHQKVHIEYRDNRRDKENQLFELTEVLESIKKHYDVWKNDESNKSNDVNFSFELHNIFAKLNKLKNK